MQEVGGSIPPGSTTLRPSGITWLRHAKPEGRSVVPGVALLGEDGPETSPDSIHRCSVRVLSFTWRSHAMAEGRSVVPGVAPLGEDELETLPDSIYPCSVRVVGYTWRATHPAKAKRARR